MLKKFRYVIVIMLALMVLTASFTVAFAAPLGFAGGDGMKVVAEDNAIINEDVNGTVIVLGNSVTVTSRIDGDLFALGNDLSFGGTVTGNAYFFANSLSIGGTVEHDIFVFGNSINMLADSDLLRDAAVFGNSLTVNGNIGRDIYMYAASVVINAAVTGNATAEIETLTLSDNAYIGGTLSYQSEKEASIASSAHVGNVEHTRPERGVGNTPAPQRNIGMELLWDVLFALISTLLIWLFLVFLAPEFTKRASYSMGKKFWRTVLTGFVAMIAIPVIAILVMVTVLGVGVGITLAVLYGVAIYLSFAIAEIAFTNALVKKWGIKPVHKNVWYVLIVAAIIKLLCAIPVFGGLLTFVIFIIGLGLFCSFIFKKDIIDSGESNVIEVVTDPAQ